MPREHQTVANAHCLVFTWPESLMGIDS